MGEPLFYLTEVEDLAMALKFEIKIYKVIPSAYILERIKKIKKELEAELLKDVNP